MDRASLRPTPRHDPVSEKILIPPNFRCSAFPRLTPVSSMSHLNPAAAALIARLRLEPLPHEGGYFARTWTSPEKLPSGRPVGTAIYFLLTPDDFSALHRLDADELWHFHAGDPVEHAQFPTPDFAPHAGSVRVARLGANLEVGEVPQLIVPSGTWQGARLAEDGTHGWALLSCTMSPGWEESGFELASRKNLEAAFPDDFRLISLLTRTT
jgi:uncharacterized protein